MYDLMPKDRYDVFADMSEEQLREILPEQSVDDYLRHGKPGDPNTDPADRLDEGNYKRALRDYAGMFDEMNRLHVVQTDRVASAREDLASVEKSIEQSRVQEEFMAATITSLTAELAETRRQLDAVVAHKTNLETRLAAVEAKIDQTQAENQLLANQWIELQLEELARIEQASQTAATAPDPVP
jgi:septal ring factor EnvC (AmiA/AmiB activator)